MKRISISRIALFIGICFTLSMLAACVGHVSTGPAAGSSLTLQYGSPASSDNTANASVTPGATTAAAASKFQTGSTTASQAPVAPETSVVTATVPSVSASSIPATPEPTAKPTLKPAPTPTPHQHVYRGATCTDGGVCDCGAKGTALGHNFKAATCTAPATCTRCGLTGDPALGHSYSGGYCIRCGDTNGPLSPEEAKWFHNSLTDEQNAEALKVARSIVASIPDGTDLDKVSAAAAAVSCYYYSGVHSEPIPGHEAEHNRYYREAYGVFIMGESSCAGCTRALGLILSIMGYSWTHVNENQYEHQWISLIMDGQEGFADGQVGWAGYGKHPLAL